MPFLRLQGITVKAARSEGDREPGMVGMSERTENGELAVDRLRGFTDLSFTTPPLGAAEAFALRHLIEGYGQTWSFASSLYGSKGKGPSSSTNTTQSASGGPVSGTGRLIVGATDGVVTYSSPLALRPGVYDANGWHAMLWRNEGAPSWKHYQISSTGAVWKDGASWGSSISSWWSTVPAGAFTLTNTTAAAVEYSDIVVLPFEVPSAWVAMFDAFLRTGLRAMPALGKVLVDGDAIPSSYPVYAHGRVIGERYVKSTLGGGSRALSFTLEEV